VWDSETFSPPPVAINDYMTNCGECIHGAWNVKNSYAISNSEYSGQHTETWFTYGGNVAEHDTLLNPEQQTAVFEGSGESMKVTNSLIAGGGWTLYSTAGGSHFEVIDNRFVRRLCANGTRHIGPGPGEGGKDCVGSSPVGPVATLPSSYGEGSGGYWPYCGFYGLTDGSFAKWEGNYWDDNLESVRESATGK
jgi:hypothetical protein